MLRFLFPIALFLSAFLVFIIQPMVAKALLPYFGGSSGVWTVNSLFFNSELLLGYSYATLLSWLHQSKRWRTIHTLLILLSLISIPIVFSLKSNAHAPEWSIIKNLTIQLGLPILVLCATAPLLQFAYSQTHEKNAKDPYFLYSASNMGSLLALIIYPFLIEPHFYLTDQFNLWNATYIIFISLLGVIFYFNGFSSEKNPKHLEIETHQPFKWYHPFYWMFLSFVPCSLMLGVTTFITTDVVSIPLLWLTPLFLYLLTFILIFRQKPLISLSFLSKNALYLLIIPLLSMIKLVSAIPSLILILLHLANFFVLSLLCHQTLYHHRPNHSQLTLFYMSLSFGGFLAGVFNGIFATNFFNDNYEYYIAMILALLVFPKVIKQKKGWIYHLVIFGLLFLLYFKESNLEQLGFIVILFCIFAFQKTKYSMILSLSLLSIFGFQTHQFKNEKVLGVQRNFYGTKKIIALDNVHALINQSTIHGLQDIKNPYPNGENAYYGIVAPLIHDMKNIFHPFTASIIGLGTGSMVCQFDKANHVHVVEVDKQVIDIAKNSDFFSYLKKCPVKLKIHEMDGRLFLESLPEQSQDLIIIDAFNSDSLPTHLLSMEAFKSYQEKLNKKGGLLINISNRHLNLQPVIKANALALNFMLFSIQGDTKNYQFASHWLFLTENPDWIKNLQGYQFDTSSKPLLWTDNYSSILPILH